jgi:hypothetical protein
MMTNVSNWIKKGLMLTAIIFLISMLALVVYRYHLEAPQWDQWELVPLLEKYYGRNLKFSDLWFQHNEHRLLLPKAVMLGLASLTRWNIFVEQIFNLFLSVIIFILFVIKVKRNFKTYYGKGLDFFILVLALLIFSLNQGESWFWSWNMQIFFNLLAVIAGIFFLSARNLGLWHLGMAVFCGLAANYSYAVGLIYWPTSLMVIAFMAGEDRKKKIVYLFLWMLIATLAISAFFINYARPEDQAILSLVLKWPWRYLQYVLAYLGAPLLPAEANPQASFLLGLSGLLLMTALSFFLLKKSRVNFRELLPFFVLSLYAIGSALLTGIGRAGYGPIQAMSSRYITLSNMFWAYIFLCLFLFLITQKKNILIYVIIISASLLLLRSSFNSVLFFKERYEWLRPAERELFLMENDDLLKRLYPNLGLLDKDELKKRVDFLREKKLALFRQAP